MRKAAVLTTTVALVAGLAAVAAPASAACTLSCTASNTATFTIAGTGLFSIAEVPALPLTTITPTGNGASVSGPLGLTTVTDGRVGSAWTVTAQSTAFTGVPAGSIAASAASLTSDLSSAAGSNTSKTTGGTATVVGSTVADLGAGGTLVSATSVTGLLSVITTYTPQISISVPSSAAAGVYTGTVTQTLS